MKYFKHIIFILSLFCFIGIVQAKKVECRYGSGGTVVVVGIDESGNLIGKNGNNGDPRQFDFSSISAGAFIDSNGKYSCPDNINYATVQNTGGIGTILKFSFVATKTSNELPNIVSGNVIDNSESSDAKKVDYSCAYGNTGQYVINYYTDGTFAPADSRYHADSSLKTNGSCLKAVYFCQGSILTTQRTWQNNNCISLDQYKDEYVKDKDDLNNNNNKEEPIPEGEIKDINFCSQPGILKAFQIVGYVLFVLKILVPLVLIGLGMVDFAKAAVSSDDKANKEALNTLIRRLIIGAVIFFIPTIINFVLLMVDDQIVNTVGKNSNFINCTNCLFDPAGKCADARLEQNNSPTTGGQSGEQFGGRK